ncbi:hypothetical protein ACFSAA_01785 [Sphingomonas qilianensis]
MKRSALVWLLAIAAAASAHAQKAEPAPQAASPAPSVPPPSGLAPDLSRVDLLGNNNKERWRIEIENSTDANLLLRSIDPAGGERTIWTVDRQSAEVRSGSGWFVENLSSDNPIHPQRTIGFSGIAINDNTAFIQSAYGIYGEARRLPGTGASQASEFNALNGGTTVDIDPYNALGAITAATWLSAGRTDLTYNNPVSAAATVIPNGAVFRRGLVFRVGSLDEKGTLEALTLPADYRISWYSGAGKPIANISANVHGGGTLNIGNLPVHADNQAAAKAGLTEGDLYRSAEGQLMVRY